MPQQHPGGISSSTRVSEYFTIEDFSSILRPHHYTTAPDHIISWKKQEKYQTISCHMYSNSLFGLIPARIQFFAKRWFGEESSVSLGKMQMISVKKMSLVRLLDSGLDSVCVNLNGISAPRMLLGFWWRCETALEALRSSFRSLLQLPLVSSCLAIQVFSAKILSNATVIVSFGLYLLFG
jgi:hypothetical protein